MCEVYYLNDENHGSAFMAVGESVVLFDPGMAYAASMTIKNIRKIIGEREVDAVFLTHSHYDHVGALPYVREVWPDVIVYGAEYCANVLSKLKVLESMEQLSRTASMENGYDWDENYRNDLISVDKIVYDGDILRIGNLTIEVMATQGHTKCSMSYFVDGNVLIASESQGIVEKIGTYSPQFLVGFKTALESVEKCRARQPEKYCMPHQGIIDYPDDKLWSLIEDGLIEAKDQILDILNTYEDTEDRLFAMERVFWNEERQKSWPRDAFRLNAQGMLNTIDREYRFS